MHLGQINLMRSHQDTPRYQKYSLNSLKGHWKNSLHPAVNKFIGIISTNPLVSGVQNDASYYVQMRGISAEQANNTSLSNSFARYMDAYKFLMSNPKFEEIILVVDKESGDRPSSNNKTK